MITRDILSYTNFITILTVVKGAPYWHWSCFKLRLRGAAVPSPAIRTADPWPAVHIRRALLDIPPEFRQWSTGTLARYQTQDGWKYKSIKNLN